VFEEHLWSALGEVADAVQALDGRRSS
jgi:hypothetical protein